MSRVPRLTSTMLRPARRYYRIDRELTLPNRTTAIKDSASRWWHIKWRSSVIPAAQGLPARTQRECQRQHQTSS